MKVVRTACAGACAALSEGARTDTAAAVIAVTSHRAGGRHSGCVLRAPRLACAPPCAIPLSAVCGQFPEVLPDLALLTLEQDRDMRLDEVGFEGVSIGAPRLALQALLVTPEGLESAYQLADARRVVS